MLSSLEKWSFSYTRTFCAPDSSSLCHSWELTIERNYCLLPGWLCSYLVSSFSVLCPMGQMFKEKGKEAVLSCSNVQFYLQALDSTLVFTLRNEFSSLLLLFLKSSGQMAHTRSIFSSSPASSSTFHNNPYNCCHWAQPHCIIDELHLGQLSSASELIYYFHDRWPQT